MQFPILKYGLVFRLVEETDAPFILSLRTDPKLSLHLSITANDLSKQKKWIRDYKERETKGMEYYFIYETEDGVPLGVVRLYNIGGGSFTSGSWLSRPGYDELAGLKSDLFVFSFAFEELKLKKCFIDVRKQNKKVLNYHKRFFTQINEDRENFYFVMEKEGYDRKIKFLKSILIPN